MPKNVHLEHLMVLSEKMLWWPIGELLHPHNDETVSLDEGELVYLIAYPNPNWKEVYRWVEPNIPSSIEQRKTHERLVLLMSEMSDEVAVITQERKIAFLQKCHVKEIDADRFEEKVLQNIASDLADISKQEKLNSLMKFFHRASNCYIERFLASVVHHTHTIFRDVHHCEFAPLDEYRKLMSALLESIQVCLHNRNLATGSFFSNLRTTRYAILLSPQAHTYFHELLHALNNGLENYPLFYFDGEPLIYISNFYMTQGSTDHLEPMVHKLKYEAIYRRSASQSLVKEMDRFYMLQNSSGEVVTDETFIIIYTDKYPAIFFDTFLRTIYAADRDHCEGYIRAFTRFIHLYPILFVAQLKGLPQLKSKFENTFDRMMKEKGIEITWKEAISDPRIDSYLNHYYHYRNTQTKSFYYAEKTFASLTYRNFGKVVDFNEKLSKFYAVSPPPLFTPKDGIDKDAIALVDDYCYRETRSSKCLMDKMFDTAAWTVFLSNGKVIKASAMELKTWQTSEKILRSSFIALMERETEIVFLGYWMSHLIYHSEDNAKIFLDFLLNSNTNMKLWHTGVCWHILFHCLEKCDGLKALLCTTPPSSYIEKLVTLFCKQMKTGFSQGTLFVYFHKLKPLLSEKQILSIQSKLEERQIICDFFTDFANQLSNYKIDETFLKYSETHSFIFFKAFSNRMLRMIYKGDGHILERDILAFRNCLHRVVELKATFCQNGFKEQLGRLLMKTDRIYPAMDHLNKIFTMTWAKYHADEIIGKTIVNQYDCDPETLKKGKKLGQGGYGTATLVRIKELAAEVVAKRFGKVNNETITLINGELECLIRMQSHPHIVHIYGYLVKNGDYEGIIMEYCHGGDLHSVIKKPETNIDEAKVLNWTRQAACGLMYLHQNKIIHRDVKPENMFLNSDRSILKLGDFGLIKFLPESVDKKSYEGELQSIFGLKRDVDNHTVSHEQHGRAIAVELSQDVGTYGFQAPEIENGDFYTTVVDVYSLGRSMWYMIFGQLFEGTTQKLMDKLKAATLGESSNPLVPSFEPSNQLNELVLNMMLQDQFKRPSMEMVYETLCVWMDQSSTQMATVEQN